MIRKQNNLVAGNEKDTEVWIDGTILATGFFEAKV